MGRGGEREGRGWDGREDRGEGGRRRGEQQEGREGKAREGREERTEGEGKATSQQMYVHTYYVCAVNADTDSGTCLESVGE